MIAVFNCFEHRVLSESQTADVDHGRFAISRQCKLGGAAMQDKDMNVISEVRPVLRIKLRVSVPKNTCWLFICLLSVDCGYAVYVLYLFISGLTVALNWLKNRLLQTAEDREADGQLHTVSHKCLTVSWFKKRCCMYSIHGSLSCCVALSLLVMND